MQLLLYLSVLDALWVAVGAQEQENERMRNELYVIRHALLANMERRTEYSTGTCRTVGLCTPSGLLDPFFRREREMFRPELDQNRALYLVVQYSNR